MTLSRNAKESIKTALALVLAYGIALSMDWDKPYWAGFAVAFISLATYGQSLNKATLRLAGTGLAVVVSFTLIAAFPQSRWLFIIFLSAWVGLCTYLMGDPKRGYFWTVSGFVAVIICMDAGPSATNAFDIAILRAEETGLGVLVYSVVASLLWPVRSGTDFKASVGQLLDAQQALYDGCRALRRGDTDRNEIGELSTHMRQAQTRFVQLLESAQADTFEVWEQREAWQRFSQHVLALGTSLLNWRDSVVGLQDIDLQKLFPGIDQVGEAMQARLDDMRGLLDGKQPSRELQPVEFVMDKAAARELGPFQLAELSAAAKRWRKHEALTRAVFRDLAAINGIEISAPVDELPQAPSPAFTIDRDRLANAGRAMLILWIAYLVWIYVPDIPGGVAVVSLSAPLGMNLVNLPQLRVGQLAQPALVSTAWAGLIYMLLLPKLTTFAELSVLLFITIFAICYLYSKPQQMLGRAFGIAMFLSVTSVSNDQVYSFLVVANTALMLPVIFGILLIVSFIPNSPAPEKHFLRLLQRYFRSSEQLLSGLGRDRSSQPTRWDALRQAHHLREIATLPGKLAMWPRLIPPLLVPADQPAAVTVLLAELEALSYRIRELVTENEKEYPPEFVASLRDDVRDARHAICQALARLVEDPAALDPVRYRELLDLATDHMETKVQTALKGPERAGLSDAQAAAFFCLLAAYRGFATALGDFSASAAAIDWSRWREERFA
jgi:uncharacterized membrane protein YccC